MNKIIVVCCVIILCSTAMAQISGIKTVGAGGDYTTLTQALAAWKANTITGNVTFSLLDSLYPSETYPLLCTIPAGYSGGNWTLTIKPASGTYAKFQGTNGIAMFDLNGIDRLVLDSLYISNRNEGSDNAGNAVRLINGASDNAVRNCSLKAACAPLTSLSGGVVFISTAEMPSGPGNNNNTIENCIITSSRDDIFPVFGVCSRGTSPMYARTNNNNTIKGCKIYNFYRYGIYFSAYDSNSTVSNNEIFSTIPQNSTLMQGIRISATSICGTQITGNKIYNLMASGAAPTLIGFYESMADADDPALFANNFISLDGVVTHDGANLIGIQHLRQEALTDTYKFYNNSIYIGGQVTSGSSYGFYLRTRPTHSTQTSFRDNIVFNNRSGGSGKHYCIYDSLGGASFSCDYNDLYVPTPGTNGQYIAYYNGIDCETLGYWQTTSTHDANSISLNPDFVSTYDLHIIPCSNSVDSRAVHIDDVISDIDNQPRNPTAPDIGADEYTPGGAYLIIATAIGPGTIVPSGMVIINNGTDTTFIITPNSSCQLDSLLVDSINHGADSTSYRFTNVMANHTIYAYFSLTVGFEELVNQYPPNKLTRIYPNPFKNKATINYSLSGPEPVSIKIYNCLGREVKTLIDELQIAGVHSLNWDGKDNHSRRVGDGVYILRVIKGTKTSQYRLILVR